MGRGTPPAVIATAFHQPTGREPFVYDASNDLRRLDAGIGDAVRLTVGVAVSGAVVLLADGLRALVHTHQSSREGRPSWAWQGVGWFLPSRLLVVRSTSRRALTGVAVVGA